MIRGIHTSIPSLPEEIRSKTEEISPHADSHPEYQMATGEISTSLLWKAFPLFMKQSRKWSESHLHQKWHGRGPSAGELVRALHLSALSSPLGLS